MNGKTSPETEASLQLGYMLLGQLQAVLDKNKPVTPKRKTRKKKQ